MPERVVTMLLVFLLTLTGAGQCLQSGVTRSPVKVASTTFFNTNFPLNSRGERALPGAAAAPTATTATLATRL